MTISFKQILTAKDLAEVYTPTPQERFVAHRSTKGRVAEVGFLVRVSGHKTHLHIKNGVEDHQGFALHFTLRRKNATARHVFSAPSGVMVC